MHNSNKPKIHVPFLILDFVGTLLVGLGAYEMVNAGHLVPETLRFEGYHIVLMVVGFMLMMPFVAWTLKNRVGQKDSR